MLLLIPMRDPDFAGFILFIDKTHFFHKKNNSAHGCVYTTKIHVRPETNKRVQMKNYLLIAMVSFTLFGCQLTRVEGKVDDVDVKVGSDGRHDGYGKFCPPGQAKKGNC